MHPTRAVPRAVRSKRNAQHPPTELGTTRRLKANTCMTPSKTRGVVDRPSEKPELKYTHRPTVAKCTQRRGQERCRWSRKTRHATTRRAAVVKNDVGKQVETPTNHRQAEGKEGKLQAKNDVGKSRKTRQARSSPKMRTKGGHERCR